MEKVKIYPQVSTNRNEIFDGSDYIKKVDIAKIMKMG
jgi:hypothetical protein